MLLLKVQVDYSNKEAMQSKVASKCHWHVASY